MTKYEMDQAVITSRPYLLTSQLEDKKQILSDYAKTGKYFMLLCRDTNYYTLFDVVDEPLLTHFADDVIECAQTQGGIKIIDLTEDQDAIEIWVQPMGEEPIIMYLFHYEEGVIKCQA